VLAMSALRCVAVWMRQLGDEDGGALIFAKVVGIRSQVFIL
jgi:hypothetical protein